MIHAKCFINAAGNAKGLTELPALAAFRALLLEGSVSEYLNEIEVLTQKVVIL